jgi:two-component system, NarL family, response regulator LiaR
MQKSIRILIADDHAIVREGLRALIATEPGLELVAEASDGVEAVEKVRTLKPDIILLDMMMPRKDGLDAIHDIIAENPDARILVLTSFAEDEKVFPAIKAGALGYLLKDSSPQDLLQAIRTVHRGEASLHPAIARKLMRELNQPPSLPPTTDPLTEREVEVLKQVAQGLSNDEIAEKLVVSERTVRTHVSHILDKLHLANRTQLALYAVREGIARLEDS